MRHFVDDKLSGDSACLGGKSANYLGRTLRLRAGDRLVLFNGQGVERDATIKTLQRDQVVLELGARREPMEESSLHLWLLQGIAKGDAMDHIVQKATELGVQTMTPILTQRSVVRLSKEKIPRRVKHWEGIAISACEQSGRHRPPSIRTPCLLASALAAASSSPHRLVLDPYADRSLDEAIKGIVSLEVALAVGPEGGFTEDEIQQAREVGFTAVKLGPRVLRVETAAIAACTVLQHIHGDMG